LVTCYIIPPAYLKMVLKEGNKDEQEWAMHTLMVSERLRGQREIVGSSPSMFAESAGKNRTVYDAHSGTGQGATVEHTEGGPQSADVAVNEAYDFSGETYDFYQRVYGRNSINDRGMPLDSYVHWRQNWRCAQWNGRAMLYGDGDGVRIQRFTKAIDVIGHELTHGVTQYEADLVYQDESGALNESISDVFGSLLKQWKLQQTADQADWMIGKGLFVDENLALRNMKAPGTAFPGDDQPSDYNNYVRMIDDFGGVHTNSGIPNHAFYLAATQIGGNAWEKAGTIWYKTLSSGLSSTSSFKEFASHTVVVAGTLFGSDSNEQKAVRKAWDDVHVPYEERLRATSLIGKKRGK
jgi:Zn-dependent metalloprotease